MPKLNGARRPRNPDRSKLEPFPRGDQRQKFGPKFQRLADILSRDPTGLELIRDPTALAPESLLVFEVRGSVRNFAIAIGKVRGLEFIDEEEIVGDDADKSPVAYLLVPDAKALSEILSLWNRWSQGRELGSGYAPWRDVFAVLRDLRPWGPADRLQDFERDILADEIFERSDDDMVTLEIELIFRANLSQAKAAEAEVLGAITAAGGRRIDRSRREEIAYHALLSELPVRAVRMIVERSQHSIVGLKGVMHIRPQSVAPSIEVADPVPAENDHQQQPTRPPILAMLDGVPIANHPLLMGRLVVDDQFELEPDVLVVNRVHGTSMASLIVHGDRNRREVPLPRRIHVTPVMTWNGGCEALPTNRLIVDLIYEAVLRMRDGPEPSAPEVLIVNLSLGNVRRPFHGQMSPWARLLDRLAWRYGILFIVSAGNVTDKFTISPYRTSVEFEGAPEDERAANTLKAIHDLMAERRIISPAETVNGLTVGGLNEDAVPVAERRTSGINVSPYIERRMPNASSRLGPGFARSIKPDILMPGAREHLRILGSGAGLEVIPARAARAFGLKVAAPPADGNAATERYTNGTSAATALASRTCHRIHDALEAAYGEAFTGLSHRQRAVVLKALLVHPAQWPKEAAQLIIETVGPSGKGQASRQKDNIRRFLGYGALDADDAIACAADRATFWAAGSINPEKSVVVEIPIPVCIGGKAIPHAMSATLAWFTPVQPGHRSYRSVRLLLLDPSKSEMDAFGVSPASAQPDSNQVKRGTVISRRWGGKHAPIVIEDTRIRLVLQREPERDTSLDNSIPFGLAVTLSMPGVIDIYDQVRQRLGIFERTRV